MRIREKLKSLFKKKPKESEKDTELKEKGNCPSSRQYLVVEDINHVND